MSPFRSRGGVSTPSAQAPAGGSAGAPPRHAATGTRYCPIAEDQPHAQVLEDAILHPDGTFTAVFRLATVPPLPDGDPPGAPCTPPLHAALNALPVGMRWALTHHITRRAGNLFQQHDALMTGGVPLARQIVAERRHAAAEALAAGDLVRDELRLALTYQPRLRRRHLGAGMPAVGFGPGAIVPERLLHQWIVARQTFEAAVDGIVHELTIAGMSPIRLTGADLRAAVEGALAPHDAETPAGMTAGTSAGTGLAIDPGALPMGEWRIQRGLVVSGDRCLAVLLLKEPPAADRAAALIRDTAQIPFECRITTEAVMTRSPRSEADAQWNTGRGHVMTAPAAAELLARFDYDAGEQRAAEEARAKYLEMTAAAEGQLRTRCTVTIAAPTPEELEARVQAVVGVFAHHGATLARTMDGKAAAELLLGTSVLGTAAELPMSRVAVTSEVAALQPIVAPWTTDDAPVTFVLGPHRRLIPYHPFPRRPNAHRVVMGKAGTGKSMLAQILDAHAHLARPNTQVVVLGPDESFARTTRAMGGRVVVLGTQGVCINPLALPVDFNALGEHERHAALQTTWVLVTALLSAMCGEAAPSRDTLPDVVVPCLRHLYQLTDSGQARRPEARLADLWRLLDTWEVGDPVIEWPAHELHHGVARQVAGALRPFVAPSGLEPGRHAHLMDGPSTVTLDGPMVTLDLAGITPDPVLRATGVIAAVVGLLYPTLYRRDGVQRLVILDEVLNMMRSPAVASTLELLWREARMMGVALAGILQSAADATDHPTGRTILANSSRKYYLAHERFHRNDQAFEKLHEAEGFKETVYGLRTHYGRWAEAAVQDSEQAHGAVGVIRATATPLQYWLATTSPRDLSTLRRYMDAYGAHGLTEVGVLAVLAADYPEGTHQTSAGSEMPVVTGVVIGRTFERELAAGATEAGKGGSGAGSASTR